MEAQIFIIYCDKPLRQPPSLYAQSSEQYKSLGLSIEKIIHMCPGKVALNLTGLGKHKLSILFGYYKLTLLLQYICFHTVFTHFWAMANQVMYIYNVSVLTNV